MFVQTVVSDGIDTEFSKLQVVNPNEPTTVNVGAEIEVNCEEELTLTWANTYFKTGKLKETKADPDTVKTFPM